MFIFSWRHYILIFHAVSVILRFDYAFHIFCSLSFTTEQRSVKMSQIRIMPSVTVRQLGLRPISELKSKGHIIQNTVNIQKQVVRSYPCHLHWSLLTMAGANLGHFWVQSRNYHCLNQLLILWVTNNKEHWLCYIWKTWIGIQTEQREKQS